MARKTRSDYFSTPTDFLKGRVEFNTFVMVYKDNNGDWDYWVLMKVINLHEDMDESYENKYLCELVAVSLEAGKKELKSARSFLCLNGVKLTEDQKVETLAEHGTSATLWSKEGNNYRELIREAMKEAKMIKSITFGFMMDRPQNRIGSTGWDFIKGDIDAGLNRLRDVQ